MNKINLYAGILASIASIIGSIILFFPKDEKSDINIATNGTLVQGNNNTIINQQISKKIDKLYPKILVDYIGVSEKKLVQDFGEPFEKDYAGGDGRIFAGLTIENHWEYIYKYKTGTLSFYIDMTTKRASAIQLEIDSRYDIKVLIPNLYYNEPSIVLGKSTFGDLLSIGKPDSFFINEGGSLPGTGYAEFEFYFGKYGNYRTYIFGTHSWSNSADEIRNNYKLLSNKKPDYVIIITSPKNNPNHAILSLWKR